MNNETYTFSYDHFAHESTTLATYASVHEEKMVNNIRILLLNMHDLVGGQRYTGLDFGAALIIGAT